MENKIKALAQHLSIDPSEIVETSYCFEADGGEYLVLTDDEADEKWEESLDYYIEECILPELPDNLRNYFDDEKWKRDAKYDGRGYSLSSYDGEEIEINIDGEWFYIYRIN
jgi:hypothetical protein